MLTLLVVGLLLLHVAAAALVIAAVCRCGHCGRWHVDPAAEWSCQHPAGRD